VKACQIKDIAKELRDLANRDTMVLPLQNGISVIDELKEQFKQENMLGGLCKIISKIESPGVINHSGIEPVIVFDELDNTETERIHMVKAVFDHAGIIAKISDDITADL